MGALGEAASKPAHISDYGTLARELEGIHKSCKKPGSLQGVLNKVIGTLLHRKVKISNELKPNVEAALKKAVGLIGQDKNFQGTAAEKLRCIKILQRIEQAAKGNTMSSQERYLLREFTETIAKSLGSSLPPKMEKKLEAPDRAIEKVRAERAVASLSDAATVAPGKGPTLLGLTSLAEEALEDPQKLENVLAYIARNSDVLKGGRDAARTAFVKTLIGISRQVEGEKDPVAKARMQPLLDTVVKGIEFGSLTHLNFAILESMRIAKGLQPSDVQLIHNLLSANVTMISDSKPNVKLHHIRVVKRLKDAIDKSPSIPFGSKDVTKRSLEVLVGEHVSNLTDRKAFSGNPMYLGTRHYRKADLNLEKINKIDKAMGNAILYHLIAKEAQTEEKNDLESALRWYPNVGDYPGVLDKLSSGQLAWLTQWPDAPLKVIEVYCQRYLDDNSPTAIVPNLDLVYRLKVTNTPLFEKTFIKMCNGLKCSITMRLYNELSDDAKSKIRHIRFHDNETPFALDEKWVTVTIERLSVDLKASSDTNGAYPNLKLAKVTRSFVIKGCDKLDTLVDFASRIRIIQNQVKWAKDEDKLRIELEALARLPSMSIEDQAKLLITLETYLPGIQNTWRQQQRTPPSAGVAGTPATPVETIPPPAPIQARWPSAPAAVAPEPSAPPLDDAALLTPPRPSAPPLPVDQDPEVVALFQRDKELAALFANLSHDRVPPDELCSPIGHELMRVPVMASDGHSYEKSEIEAWFRQCKTRGDSITSPLTGERLENTNLTPNITLQKVIRTFLERASRTTA